MVDTNFFKCIGSKKVKELADYVSGRVVNDNDELLITAAAPLNNATKQHVSFLNNPKYKSILKDSGAGACILEEKFISFAPQNMALIVVEHPYVAYAKIANLLHPDETNNGLISQRASVSATAKLGVNCTVEPGAVISDNAVIGNNCYIGANCYIGKNVKLGDNCKIMSQVSVQYAILGNGVILHPGVAIGQDGFGYATDQGVHIKVPQLGRVIIEDDVEIGANSTVDRGAGPDTIIGTNTKIDNLVQIGHNVQIGRGCVIVSQVGISGSTSIGNYVVIGGQVGIVGHIKIGDGVTIAAKSGVKNDIAAGEIVGGLPAIPMRDLRRQIAMIQRLTKQVQEARSKKSGGTETSNEDN